MAGALGGCPQPSRAGPSGLRAPCRCAVRPCPPPRTASRGFPRPRPSPAGGAAHRVHTIRTQLRSGLPWAVSARLRGAQWDDMADLQTAVADDDALDDELQDRLLVGKRRFVQAGVNAITKRL